MSEGRNGWLSRKGGREGEEGEGGPGCRTHAGEIKHSYDLASVMGELLCPGVGSLSEWAAGNNKVTSVAKSSLYAFYFLLHSSSCHC